MFLKPDGLLTGAIDTLEHGPAYALDAAINVCPSAERIMRVWQEDWGKLFWPVLQALDYRHNGIQLDIIQLLGFFHDLFYF